MTDKVAVIAVHGVADQQPGETARALVNLLVSAQPNGATYQAQQDTTVTLAVPPLAPWSETPHSRIGEVSPSVRDRTVVKAFAQSMRSDLTREQPAAPPAMAHAGRPSQLASREHTAPPTPLQPTVEDDLAPVRDTGLEYTNYLLGKHIDNGAGQEAYETRSIQVTRTDGAAPLEVDVYEMYWADLSRLSGSVPRIITEAFTLIFRLSRLGRETMDLAGRSFRRDRWHSNGSDGGRAWAFTASLQRALDWWFVNVLAMLTLQLALCGVLLVVFGLARSLSPTGFETIVIGIPFALAALGVLLFIYRVVAPSPGGKNLLLPLALVTVAVIGAWPSARPWTSLALVLALMSLAVVNGLKVAAERFPFALVAGVAAWVTNLILIVAGWVRERYACVAWLAPDAPCTEPGPLDSHPALVEFWMRGALHATEWWLWFTKYAWVVLTVAAVLWLLSGLIAGFRRGYQVRGSLATGRLGLVVSIGAFLAAAMGLWAILGWVLNYAVCGFSACTREDDCSSVPYTPSLFTTTPPDGHPIKTAYAYLEDRFTQSTDAFGLVAGVLTILIGYLVVMLLPSVLAELKFLVEKRRQASRERCRRMLHNSKLANHVKQDAAERLRHAEQLGKWLTRGYRYLDAWTLLVVVLGLIFSVLVALMYVGVKLDSHVADLLTQTSSTLLPSLQKALIGAAGLTASLIAFGGLLSKYAPMLRGPLDVALDVDNHFREFPRTEIPRARIFSRYAALLDHVRVGGYRHIVVVAHSQGTVISAELLRFLLSKGRKPASQSGSPAQPASAAQPVRLLTLGCPLRQLYAARFPTLYRWVLREPKAGSPQCGPRASDIGVERWFNAFCAGDYVGRWLWCNPVARQREHLSHPCDDATTGLGRDLAYAPFTPMPPEAKAFLTQTEAETCLGLGAHTHYFEPEQKTVAWLIDYLVTAAPLLASPVSPGPSAS